MKKNILRYSILLLLPAAVLLCLGLWYIQTSGQQITIDSATGTFDMQRVDFNQYTAGVSRTVEYIPDVWLTPEEFELRKDRKTGTVPQDTRVSTMRIRILVPDERQYGICGYSVNYASKVYVNGKWLFSEGRPGRDYDSEKSSDTYRIFSAEPHDGVIEILIQTSSFSNIDTSSGMGWTIGSYERIRNQYIRSTLVDVVVMSWYVIIAFISLLLFLTLPSYPASGWMALLAAAWCIRSGITHTRPLLTLLPGLEWPFVFKAEIISSPMTLLLMLLIFNSAFPGAFPKWLRRSMMGIAFAAGLTVICLPWQTFLGQTKITNPTLFAMQSILFLLIMKSVWGRQIDFSQKLMILSLGLILFTFLWDATYFHFIIPLPFSLTQPMVVIFSLFMLVAVISGTMRKTADAQSESARLRIQLLRSQIQPHFLFNVLTSIVDLCEGKPAAQKALITFSEYLRVNMNSLTQTHPVPFTEELHHVKQYLWLQKLRFEDKLTIEYDIRTTSFVLPVLTLQPVVENAVCHGIMANSAGGTVRIRSEKTSSGFRISVQDNGPGFEPTQPVQDGRSHVGIHNVRSRLASISGGSLIIHSKPGGGTLVLIEIPEQSPL